MVSLNNKIPWNNSVKILVLQFVAITFKFSSIFFSGKMSAFFKPSSHTCNLRKICSLSCRVISSATMKLTYLFIYLFYCYSELHPHCLNSLNQTGATTSCPHAVGHLQPRSIIIFCFNYFWFHCFTDLILLVPFISQWHYQSLQLPNPLDTTAFLSIFTKFLGSPWCTLSKKLLSLTLSVTGLSNKLEVHYFFNTSSSWQDWTKLRYYVLQHKKMAWTIPAVSYTHFFREQGSLFLQYHYHQLPVSFFQHDHIWKANCDIKYSLSACLSSG